jgi:hypothetical protein
MDRPLRWVVGLLVAAAVWIALGQPEWSWQVACAALLLAAGLLWLLVRTGRGNTGESDWPRRSAPPGDDFGGGRPSRRPGGGRLPALSVSRRIPEEDPPLVTARGRPLPPRERRTPEEYAVA